MIGDVLNGIAFGSILFVLASGFSLALGVIRIVNIAHGAFYSLAVYVALTVSQAVGNFLVAAIASAVAVMLLAAFLQRFLLRRFGLEPLPQVLSTFGVTLVIVEVCRLIWGGYPQVLRTPEFLSGAATFGSVIIPRYRLFLIVVAVVLAVVLWVTVERTRVGALVRAAVDDEEIARSIGINIERLYVALFGVAGFLTGLGGALGGPVLGTYQGVEFEVLTLTLVVVVLGGMGSLPGAFLGSMFVGIIDSVGKVAFPELSYFVLFVPMIILLTFRPTGLMGKRVAGDD
jgi:branched-chain amino acid transport system permease protein